MIKILKATKKEALDKDWKFFTKEKYGESAVWKEINFRFKAVEEGKIIGTIDGKLEGDVVYVGALMTAKDLRGKGVGTLLIKKAEEFGKKVKAKKVWLLTGSDWQSNSFYKKLGFVQVATIPSLYFNKDFNVYKKAIK